MSENNPTVGSLFSGIGGFDLGLECAGWRVAWQVENNPFRQKILRRHWPDVELRDDIVTDTGGLPRVDLICGGFPCQDVSVAGKRAGLAGERSGLFFEFARLLRTLAPRWTLVENVPGLLSSNHGRDFAVVVSTLAELGYWWTYRVLDSRYFGVAQRRRRVYVVGHLGGPCPLEILFEPESLRGHTPPVEETRPEVAGTIGGRPKNDLDGHGAYLPERSHPLHGRGGRNNDLSKKTYVVNARQDPITGLPSLDTNPRTHAVAVEDAAYALRSGRGRLPDSNGTTGNIVLSPPPDADRVRETAGLPGRLDATPDSPRYAALGDAVTVSVAEWIGRRILTAHRNTEVN